VIDFAVRPASNSATDCPSTPAAPWLAFRRGSDQGNTPDAESLGQRGFGASM
jgi:hypothetical protein